MDFQDDAAEFSSEDVDTIVKNAITGCLTDVMYNPKKVRLTYIHETKTCCYSSYDVLWGKKHTVAPAILYLRLYQLVYVGYQFVR